MTNEFNEEVVNVMEFTGMEVEDIGSTDAMYYLEEMIECGLADETEQNVYYDIKLMNRYKKNEMAWVKKNMIKMYNEKF